MAGYGLMIGAWRSAELKTCVNPLIKLVSILCFFTVRPLCIDCVFGCNLAVVFIVLAAVAHKKRINMSALCIGVDFLQIISIFTSFDFQWPLSLKKLFAVASATTYNDQLVAPECSVKTWTFELKWCVVY